MGSIPYSVDMTNLSCQFSWSSSYYLLSFYTITDIFGSQLLSKTYLKIFKSLPLFLTGIAKDPVKHKNSANAMLPILRWENIVAPVAAADSDNGETCNNFSTSTEYSARSVGVAGRVFLYLRKGQFSYAFDTTYANLQQKHHETRAEECPKKMSTFYYNKS